MVAELTIFPELLLVGDGKLCRLQASARAQAVCALAANMDGWPSKDIVVVDLMADLGGQLLEKQRLALVISGCQCFKVAELASRLHDAMPASGRQRSRTQAGLNEK
jgi:hypothetical protein